jgi:hypothetical protein
MNRVTLLLLIMFFAAVTGCSKTASIVTPESSYDSGLPSITPPAENSNHNLLGIWTCDFDIESNSCSITTDRIASQHFNVTSVIPSPNIVIRSYDPVTQIVDVDVYISNPYPVDVYDVRLIIFTDNAGHMLINDDSWTSLYDIPGGLPINPFKAYAKAVSNRKFAGSSQSMENLQVFLPGGNPNVTFAIDASYPGNCEEPYEISNFSQGTLYDIPGSSTTCQVTAYDHQNDVNSLILYCPEITGASIVDFQYLGSYLWATDLENITGAAEGSYTGYLRVTSSNSGSLALYKTVTVTITCHKIGWVDTWGGPDRNGRFGDIGYGIAIDNSGNVFVAGSYTDTVDFDPGQGIDEHTSSPGNYPDIFLSAFNTNGIFLWARTWGNEGVDKGFEVAADDSGHVYITGYFQNTVDFDPGPGIEERTSIGLADIFLSKFDTNGNLIWVRTWAGQYNDTLEDTYLMESSSGLDIVDGTKNILVSGSFLGTVDFNPGPGEDWHTSNGGFDIYLSSFDKDGNFLWAVTWGGIEDDGSNGLIAYGLSSVYITGVAKKDVDFDPSPDGEDIHLNLGYQGDAYLSKLNTDGEFIWAKTWGDYGREVGNEVTADPSENIYVTGCYGHEVDFDPGSGIEEHTATTDDANDSYLSKFDLDGDFIWVRCWGSDSHDYSYSVIADNTNNIYVTGYFYGLGDFDPGPGEDWGNSIYTQEGFLSKFTSTGDYCWVRIFDDQDGEEHDGFAEGFDLNVDSMNNVYLTGFYHGDVDFDPGSTEYLTESIGKDAYILKIMPNGYWE